MITCLLCRCHGSEPIARKIMRDSGYQAWQSQPVIKGREACMNYLDTIPQDKEVDKLKEYLKRQSSWSVILGYDGQTYRWADAGHGLLKNKLDAEVIVKDFGNDS